MEKNEEPAERRGGRRSFLQALAAALGCGGMAIAANAVVREAAAAAACEPPKPDIPGYDWSKHRWAFGVDATKCIGCLRCVEACKTENDVAGDAHHFRTWVERYVYLEGEDKPRIDSQADPVNIAASGSESEYRFANRYKDAKVEKAFFVPKLCNHCTHPACVQVCPTGATYRTEDGVVAHRSHLLHRLPVLRAGLPLRRALLQRGEAASRTSAPGAITASPRDCSPPASRSARSARASSAICNDKQSPISQFIRNNRVQVLRPETGNAPNVFYVGIDKEVS